MNTVTASFDTTVRQMTKMSRRKKASIKLNDGNNAGWITMNGKLLVWSNTPRVVYCVYVRETTLVNLSLNDDYPDDGCSLKHTQDQHNRPSSPASSTCSSSSLEGLRDLQPLISPGQVPLPLPNKNVLKVIYCFL